eukprot:gene12626-14595_t
MSNEYVYRQVKKCEIDSADGVYTPTDGGKKFVKDSFVMYRNNLGVWTLCEVLDGTSTKLFYAAKSGKDITQVNWLFRNNRRVEQSSAMKVVEQSSAMKVSVCNSSMNTGPSSSASLPFGQESSIVNDYESTSVYLSKPVGGPHTITDRLADMYHQLLTIKAERAGKLVDEQAIADLRGISASLQSENHTLRGRIAERERLLAAQQDRANALQDEVHQREGQVAHVKTELKSLTHQHHDVLRALKNGTEPTLQQVTAQKSHIAELEKELAAEKTLTASLKVTATCAFQKQNSLIGQLTNADACIAKHQSRIAVLECARDDPANDPEMCTGAGSVLLSSTFLPTPEWANDPVYCVPPPVPVSASQNYADANTDTVAADERTMNLERTVAALVAQVKKCELKNVDGIYTSTDGAWKIRTSQGDQNSAMKVTVSTKSPMQTRSSSSASLPAGSNSNKMNTYESSNVYSTKPVGGPGPSLRQIHSSPGSVQHDSPERHDERRSPGQPQGGQEYILKLHNDLKLVQANNMVLINSLQGKDQAIAELNQQVERLSKQGENVYHQLQTLRAEREAKPGDEQMAADLRRIRHERSELTATNQTLLDEVEILKTRIASLASAASTDVSGPLQSENEALRSRITKLEGQLAAQQDRSNSLQDEVRQREETIGQIKAELKSLTHQHHDVLRALKNKNDTEPTLQQVTAQKSHIAELEKELTAEKTLSAGLKNNVGDLEKILEQTKRSQEGQKEQFAVYQDALRQRDDYIAQLDAAHAAELAHLKKQYQATLIHLQDEAEATATNAAIEHAAALEKERELIKDIKDKEKAASERADTLMARAGKSYIKRDVQQTKFESPFPAGDTFLAGFKKDFLGFDTFLND